MDKDTAKQIMKSGGWLAGVPEPYADRFMADALLVEFEPGQFLFRRDDPPGGLYGIVEGAVLVGIATPTNSNQLVGYGKTCGWLGQKGSLVGVPRTMTFEAAGHLTTLHLPLSATAKFLAGGTEETKILASLSEWHYDMAVGVIADLLIPSLEQRIASILLRLANYPFGIAGPDGWTIELSQTQIADLSNVSRDNVNRCLTKFRGRGWLESGYKWIRLTQPEAMRAFVSRDDDD
ncbi:Crp/Fnr family transcriptional regulator [Parasphingopyxis sp.]|uniref:Crp/Fnr family transcriptional regulator n=1 Tax=Parasphingopyxis sp. TaxID=1920299 RepID=UPI0026134675|nr:Crp/Fnr family transcriptional regulator [Parasphingopyxis sp.]